MLLIPYALREHEGLLQLMTTRLVPKGEVVVDRGSPFWLTFEREQIRRWPWPVQEAFLSRAYALDATAQRFEYPVDDARFIQHAAEPILMPTDDSAQCYWAIREVQPGEVLTWDRVPYNRAL